MSRVLRKRAAAEIATREHAVAHRAAALLLDYPSAATIALLPQLTDALEELRPALRDGLIQTATYLGSTPLAQLETEYVETFDLKRKCSLYLTYFAYGDTRKRGVALVQFKQAYQKSDMVVQASELPDYLPVVLEFAAMTDATAGIELLLAHRAGLEVLRRALTQMESPWAGAMVAVCQTLPALHGNEKDAVERLIAQGPPEEEVGLEPYGKQSLPMPTVGAPQ